MELTEHTRALLDDEKMLSVLIPTLSSRTTEMRVLLDDLTLQIGARTDIEVLGLLDCKTMTLGAKRNHLMDLAKGTFLVFLNDDDTIEVNWLDTLTRYISENPDVDVLSVRAKCMMRMNDSEPWQHAWNMATSLKCSEKLLLKNYPPRYLLHKPVMWCAWRTSVARTARFPDKTYGEDTDWSAAVSVIARSEVVVPEVLYTYWADDSSSEAGVWKDERIQSSEIEMGLRVYDDHDDMMEEQGELMKHVGLVP